MSLPASRANTGSSPWERPLEVCRKHLVHAAWVSAAINVLYLAPTIFMLQVYDRIVPSQGEATLVFITVLLVASLAVLSFLEFIRSQLLIRATLRLERSLSVPLLKNVISIKGDPRRVHLLREFDIFRQAATGAGALALFDAPWIPVYVVLSVMLHPLLGLVPLFGAGVLAYLTFATERATRRPLEVAGRAAAEAYGSQTEATASLGAINALGMASAIVRMHEKQRWQVVALQSEASGKAAALIALTRFARLALQSTALGLAAFLVLHQQLSAGGIFAASLLTSRALGPLEQLLGSWRSLEEARNAYRALRSVVATDAGEPKTRLPPPSGKLTVEKLTLRAEGEERLILDDVSLDLSPGRVLGVVGPSGSGKTALVSSLVGARDIDGGVIRIDGADVRDWTRDDLGKYIGYVPQNLGLLSGSVKQNIVRFRDQLDDDLERLDLGAIAAAKMTGAHELILKLPQGYDTILGPGGQGVSLGQAQRIAIARAFFGEPPILVMDEPNAHLDAAGEAALIRAIESAKAGGAAIVLVAHRNSLFPVIDDLVVLTEGRVVQQGHRDHVLIQMRPPPRPPPLPLERRFA